MILSTVLIIQFLSDRIDGFPMNPNPLRNLFEKRMLQRATTISKVLF
jgi:hypothetical protein